MGFLIISVYNSRALNTNLMAKLEETEVEVRAAIDNQEDCAVKLDSRTEELTGLKDGLDSAAREAADLKDRISGTETQLAAALEEKDGLLASLAALQSQVQEKDNILHQNEAQLK